MSATLEDERQHKQAALDAMLYERGVSAMAHRQITEFRQTLPVVFIYSCLLVTETEQVAPPQRVVVRRPATAQQKLQAIFSAFTVSVNNLAAMLDVDRTTLWRWTQMDAPVRRSTRGASALDRVHAAAQSWLVLSGGQQMQLPIYYLKVDGMPLLHAIAQGLGGPQIRLALEPIWLEQCSGRTPISDDALERLLEAEPSDDGEERRLQLRQYLRGSEGAP